MVWDSVARGQQDLSIIPRADLIRWLRRSAGVDSIYLFPSHHGPQLIHRMAPSIELTRIRPSESSRFLTEDPQRLPSSTEIGDLFSHTHSNDEDTLAEIHPAWKRNLHALLEQPKSSSSAFLIHMLTTFLILFSALVTVLETVPAFHSISTRAWFGVETSLVALFTIEYIARCLAWSGSWMSFLKWTTCTLP